MNPTDWSVVEPDDDPQPQPGAAGCYADSCQLGALWLLTVTVTAALLRAWWSCTGGRTVSTEPRPVDALWAELILDACASDGPIRDADVKNAVARMRPKIEAALDAERSRSLPASEPPRSVVLNAVRAQWPQHYSPDEAKAWIAAVDRVEASLPASGEAQLRAALDEAQRMLEYLWGATGDRAPDMPVNHLFNDDDPLIQDVPSVLGRARMALAASPARVAEERTDG